MLSIYWLLFELNAFIQFRKLIISSEHLNFFFKCCPYCKIEISYVTEAVYVHKFQMDRRTDLEQSSVVRTNICRRWESNKRPVTQKSIALQLRQTWHHNSI